MWQLSGSSLRARVGRRCLQRSTPAGLSWCIPIEEEEGDIFGTARQLFSMEQAAELAQRWQMAKQEHMARHAK